MVNSWSIVGAGPVGSMEAVLLATIFPGQVLEILDQRPVHQRNHGLQIRNATIDDITQQLEQIAAQINRSDAAHSVYNQLILENINKTKTFLEKSFKSVTGGQFIRTKNISIKLQKFAENLAQNNQKILGMGNVTFHLGDAYKIGETQLNKLKKPHTTETEAERILQNSSLIYGADGSHSQVRTHIFLDPEPPKDVIQHLVEIKLDMKPEPEEHSSIASSKERMHAASDFVNRSLLPTLKRGKLHVWTVGSEGTATLHILVAKEIYDSLLSKNNTKGTMGVPGNAYTRLRQLPIAHGVRALVTEAIRDTIGLDNIEPETIKITTIPMHVYSAKKLVTVVNGKAYILAGDSGAGLIFIRGVNHGLQSAMAYVSSLFQLFGPQKSPEEIAEYQFPEQIPEELLEAETKLKAMYDAKVREIKSEQKKIDTVLDIIDSSHSSSRIFSSRSYEEDAPYDPDYQLTPQIELRTLLQDLDNELNKIEIVLDHTGNDLHISHKAYRSWLPALDLLANEFDHAIYRLEKTSRILGKDRTYLKKALNKTIDLVKKVTATQDKEQQKTSILEFKKQVAEWSKNEDAPINLSASIRNTLRTMLDYYLPSLHHSIFATKVDSAAYAVVNAGLQYM